MDLIDIWNTALRCPYGVVVETDDIYSIRPELYRIRKASGRQDLMKLAIAIPATPNQLWIVPKPEGLDD